MSSNDAPAAPNYQPIADAQLRSAELSHQIQREMFDWAKQQYNNNKGTIDTVVEGFLRTQAHNERTALADRKRYEDIYQPLEDSLAKDAADYASPTRMELNRGRATAEVANQFGQARLAAQRNLEAFGINPNSTRFAALDTNIRTQQAAAAAAAANQADMMTEATGRALRSEAINVGRGYPGQVAGQYGTSLAGGTAGVNAPLALTQSGASTMGTPMQWNAAGNSAYTGAANTMNTQFGNQMDAWKAEQQASSGWGAALGGLAGLGMGFLGMPTASVGGKLLGFAGGGAVDGEGAIPLEASPSRGAALDDVDAKLTPGEFVIPNDVVRFKGTEFFHKLIMKARESEGETEEGSGAIPSVHPAARGVPGVRNQAALELD